MTEEKKPKKREYNDARRKATQNYMDKHGRIALTMTKEQKQQIIQDAQRAGMSTNQYILTKLLNN